MLPSRRSLSSFRAFCLSLRSCFSISWFIRRCSLASSDRQQAIVQVHESNVLFSKFWHCETAKAPKIPSLLLLMTVLGSCDRPAGNRRPLSFSPMTHRTDEKKYNFTLSNWFFFVFVYLALESKQDDARVCMGDGRVKTEWPLSSTIE